MRARVTVQMQCGDVHGKALIGRRPESSPPFAENRTRVARIPEYRLSPV
jgi:hypothetical protein